MAAFFYPNLEFVKLLIKPGVHKLVDSPISTDVYPGADSYHPRYPAFLYLNYELFGLLRSLTIEPYYCQAGESGPGCAAADAKHPVELLIYFWPKSMEIAYTDILISNIEFNGKNFLDPECSNPLCQYCPKVTFNTAE